MYNVSCAAVGEANRQADSGACARCRFVLFNPKRRTRIFRAPVTNNVSVTAGPYSMLMRPHISGGCRMRLAQLLAAVPTLADSYVISRRKSV